MKPIICGDDLAVYTPEVECTCKDMIKRVTMTYEEVDDDGTWDVYTVEATYNEILDWISEGYLVVISGQYTYPGAVPNMDVTYTTIPVNVVDTNYDDQYGRYQLWTTDTAEIPYRAETADDHFVIRTRR